MLDGEQTDGKFHIVVKMTQLWFANCYVGDKSHIECVHICRWWWYVVIIITFTVTGWTFLYFPAGSWGGIHLINKIFQSESCGGWEVTDWFAEQQCRPLPSSFSVWRHSRARGGGWLAGSVKVTHNNNNNRDTEGSFVLMCQCLSFWKSPVLPNNQKK